MFLITATISFQLKKATALKNYILIRKYQIYQILSISIKYKVFITNINKCNYTF